MEVPARVQECQPRGIKRKRDDADLSLASTQYGVRLFSFLPPQPQSDQHVPVKEEKQNPSQVYHWRYAQGEGQPKKKPKKEHKATAVIKRVLKSRAAEEVQTRSEPSNEKMKISNLLCGSDGHAPKKVIRAHAMLVVVAANNSYKQASFKSHPLHAQDNPKYQVVVTSEVHLQYTPPKVSIDNLKPASSILDQIHQKYAFPLESSSQINFAPVISFNHSALTANALNTKSLLSR